MDSIYDKINTIFNNYDYFKQLNNIYIKKGRDLEYYSYDAITEYATVPIINKTTIYKVKISKTKIIEYFRMHLENNKKYIHNI